jgi:hypothetical protein
MNTPKPPDSPTNIQRYNRPQHNYMPTPSTPQVTYTQDNTGYRRNNSQPLYAHISMTSSPTLTTLPQHASSTQAKPGTSLQPRQPMPHAPSLKSYTPRTTKDTITSDHGARPTRTRTHNHSKATNTNGRHIPQRMHHHQPSPPPTWTHTELPHGRRYSYNRPQNTTHKDTCNNAFSQSPQPMPRITRTTLHVRQSPPDLGQPYSNTYAYPPTTPST